MKSEDSKRFKVCGQRYEQRRAQCKAGWADEASYHMMQRILNNILSTSPLPSVIRFLELGCGNGNVSLYMAKKGHEAYGIDIVPQAIEWARQQAKEQQLKAQFTEGSVVTLAPYIADFFDLVFDANCLFMIIEEEDRKKCISNVCRVLKKGGLFYAAARLLNETVKSRIQVDSQVWFDPEGQYSTAQGQPMYYFSRERDFVNLIESSGFRIMRKVKKPRPDDYPVYCAGDMWVLAKKDKSNNQQITPTNSLLKRI